MSKVNKFPLWFTILTIMLIISNFFIFGWATLLHPKLAWPDLGESAAFPIQFFAVRHIAFAIPLLHGLIKKNTTILRTCYTIFLIVAILDVALLLINGYYIPLVGELPRLATIALSVGAFIVPMAIAVAHLKKYKD